MKKTFLSFITLLAAATVSANADQKRADTTEVNRMDTRAFQARLTDPQQTQVTASKALALAKQTNYQRGIGESYRMIGIAYYYMDQADKAANNYLAALEHFGKIKDERSEAKVYNNLGNLYRDKNDQLALIYFSKSLTLAQRQADLRLCATLLLNTANVYQHMNDFERALSNYQKCNGNFEMLGDTISLIQCKLNMGMVYYKTKQYAKAENLLLMAGRYSKSLDLNESLADIDLKLADLYLAENKFKQAEETIAQGIVLSKSLKSDKLEADFKLCRSRMDVLRKTNKGN